MALASTKRSNKRPRYEPLSSGLQKPTNNNVIVIDDDEEDNNNGIVRRWDEMDREILVSIMKRVNIAMLLYSVCMVCNSWGDAVLDSLFPPGEVLDLRCLTSTWDSRRARLCYFMKLHLYRMPAIPPYTKLVLPRMNVPKSMFMFLARRLPLLKSITFLGASNKLYGMHDVARIWNAVEDVHCEGSLIPSVSHYWNQIRRLELSRFLKVPDACVIAERLPHLTHLSLERCRLLDNALSIILEGQKKLIYLNTRHAVLCDSFVNGSGKQYPSVVKEWDDQVLSKASGITQLLKCSRRNCSICLMWYYPPL